LPLLVLGEDPEDPDDPDVDDDDEDEEEPSDELEVLAGLALGVLDSEPDDDDFASDVVGPLADVLDERESLMYQPLPLNTMPTGWMILRSVPPHCSHVVSAASEKLWRFSITSLQAVQV
jgi:hypothetical protein